MTPLGEDPGPDRLRLLDAPWIKAQMRGPFLMSLWVMLVMLATVAVIFFIRGDRPSVILMLFGALIQIGCIAQVRRW